MASVRRGVAPVLGGLLLVGAVGVGTGLAPAAAAAGWTPTEATLPANAASTGQWINLQSLSCPTTSWCVAVGSYTDTAGSAQGLIDTFAGGLWTPSEAPTPGNAVNPATNGSTNSAFLSKVTCWAVGSCIAIGSFGPGLIETLSDGVWTATEAPMPVDVPAGTPAVSLNAIACPAAGSCDVLGEDDIQTPTQRVAQLFVDTLSGGSWTEMDVPLPANAAASLYGSVKLDTLSCPAVGSCVAVGAYVSSHEAGLIDTLSDGSWTAAEAPEPTNTATTQYTELGAVACPVVGTCVATGQYASAPNLAYQAVIETLSGGTWTAMEAPLPATTATVENQTELGGVTCPEVSSCVAVGSFATSVGNPGLVETLASGVWTPTQGPTPVSDTQTTNSLQSVTCPAAGSCVANGQYPSAAGSRPFIETLVGGTGTVTELALPPTKSPSDAALNALSCPTASSCTAVGTFTDPKGNGEGLIETLPGTSSPPAFTSTTNSKPSPSTLTIGQSATDVATVTGNGSGGHPTGTVRFYACGPTSIPTPCTFQSDPVGNAASLIAGTGNSSTATSVSFTPVAGGYWCFAAYYSGDGNYSASFDASTSGCVLVPRSVTSTTASSGAPATILFGQSDSALAKVAGNTAHGSPTGTVDFYDCVSAAPAPCNSLNNRIGGSVALSAGSGNTATAASVSFVPEPLSYVGYWCIAAYYSGDTNYEPSSSGVTAAAGCVYVTSLNESTVTSAPSQSMISLGQSVTDMSTVTGNTTYGAPTGALGFYVCGPTPTPNPCFTTSDPVGTPVGLTATGPTTSKATSVPFTPNALGYWCFQADYPGSGSYVTVYDQTTDGCVNVVGGPPTLTSADSASAIAKKPFTFTVTATGSPVPTIVATHLPKWLVLTNDGNGTATLSATKAKKGRHRFTLSANSGHSETQQTFTLTVRA